MAEDESAMLMLGYGVYGMAKLFGYVHKIKLGKNIL